MSQFLKRILKYFLYFISGLTLLGASLIVYLMWFQPPFYFPKPTGKYAVGVKNYHWIDTSRKETLANDPVHPNRELMVKIWYPTLPSLRRTGPAEEKTIGNSIRYIPQANFFQQNMKRQWFLLQHSRAIYSWAQPGAAITTDQAQFPVIIYSHGFGCTYNNNTAQCEELASYGYVVVGINHTYDSSITQFPDGRVADGMTSMGTRLSGKKFMEVEQLLNTDIEIWVGDVRFVLDQLEQLTNDKESMFYQRLDQKDIGMFGHSFGGATTIQMCARDARMKAGVALDGPMFGPDVTKNFKKPFMFLIAEDCFKRFQRQPMDRNDLKKYGISSPEEEAISRFEWFTAPQQIARSIGMDAYTFIIKGANHIAFCDNSLLKQVSIFSCLVGDLGTGAINGFRMTEIVNSYLVNFFNKYLKRQPSELLDGKDNIYPEVETKRCVD
jgi:dienelactone hydrolase